MRKSNNFAVITTINPPSEAVRLLSRREDLNLVVVGDEKTPNNWRCEGSTYLSLEAQYSLKYQILRRTPRNHQARVNLGYLYAIENGAERITQIDDDNIPTEKWRIPDPLDIYDCIDLAGWHNIYSYFTDEVVWPRGYPLDKILNYRASELRRKQANVKIWQHLADGDTDVDAIYRLTRGGKITFQSRAPIALSVGAVCPINCQSTTFFKDAFPLLYLPAYVSPRASDIIRGIVAQPILWKFGYLVGFTPPIVEQIRNPHNCLVDFKEELLIYIHSEEIFETATTVARSSQSMAAHLSSVYAELVKKGVLPLAELELLADWLDDLEILKVI